MQTIYRDCSPSPKELPARALPLLLVVLSTAIQVIPRLPLSKTLSQAPHFLDSVLLDFTLILVKNTLQWFTKEGYMGGNHSQNQTGRYEISLQIRGNVWQKMRVIPKYLLVYFLSCSFTTLFSDLFHHLASSFILPHPHPWEELESQLYIQYFFESSQRTLFPKIISHKYNGI